LYLGLFEQPAAKQVFPQPANTCGLVVFDSRREESKEVPVRRFEKDGLFM
jgi:hypothetical protein